jgi:hypothetical protein
MRQRIAVAFALGFAAWFFLIRPATRGVALADVNNRVNEDRCCTDGLKRSPNACARALEELERMAPREQLDNCAALLERGSRDPARRLCGYLASQEDREAAAAELASSGRLGQAAAQPGCNRMGKMAALHEALKGGCEKAMPVADALPANDPQRAAILRRCGKPADAWPRPATILVPPLHAPVPRTDAVSALEACTRRIYECPYGNLRTFDACAISIPACKTDPWWTDEEVCCPQACMNAYAAARAAGKNQITAMQDAYRADGTCGGGG